jgi:hypothetical protein
MPGWKRRLLGLGLPCVLAFLFDVGLTMHGQPEAYWAGDYRQTNEGAPFFRKLYIIHPLAVAAGEALWLAVILTWVLLLPEVLAVVLTVAVVLGHTAGGCTWLFRVMEVRWFQTAHGVIFASATILGLGLYGFLYGKRLAQAALPASRRHPLLRWGLIVIASGVACYMYLIPQ